VAQEHILLVGGPGDGQTFEWKGGDLLRWKPSSPADYEFVRANGFVGEAEVMQQFHYRRSLRTRSKFVYQP
jgi:hypothetical protein